MRLFFCFACIVIAACFIYAEYKQKPVPALIFKGLASFCFVMYGLLTAPEGNPIAEKIVLGLVMGMIADVLLNMRFVLKNGKPVFLVGILVFLIGHIIYLLAIFPMISNPIPVIIVTIILTALLIKWIFSKITAEKAFKIFGIFYIGAIVLLNCTAFANLIRTPSAFTVVFAAGAFLFLISDIILILNTFGKEQIFRLRAVNLSLYYIGQLLIATSMYCL